MPRTEKVKITAAPAPKDFFSVKTELDSCPVGVQLLIGLTTASKGGNRAGAKPMPVANTPLAAQIPISAKVRTSATEYRASKQARSLLQQDHTRQVTPGSVLCDRLPA
eukprot:CAMPEP_0202119772 /NCGR_PEP_ID=MMETSP0965-20130614/43814_1 /ASSEMBLY_ACC=CAM_ASM_000507 /TAXON_ID=4773 /ORGANISM="Schizochytrium aggregatum, Strain ATCC28209" /LENGTH=107 /DNA_ID=CAMNT_0048689695 /DNA_START=1400 /DNA_END=1719 /DNA_ORIENTATION=-